MTFDELLKLDDSLLALYQEATAHRVILVKTGKPGRICWYGAKEEYWPVAFAQTILATVDESNEQVAYQSRAEIKDGKVRMPLPAERHADRSHCYPDPKYCANLEWNGTEYTPARGEVSLKHLLSRVIDNNPALQDFRDGIMGKFMADMPPCQHEGNCPWGTKPTPPPSSDPNKHSFSRGERIEGGKIVSDPPFTDLLSLLGGEPKPMPGLVSSFDGIATKWTYKLPKDEGDPCYVVLSEWEAAHIAQELQYPTRFSRGEISKRYLDDSIYVCGPEQRDLLLSENLTRRTLDGYFFHKPVVLTFRDPGIEDKLAKVCHSVATVLPAHKKWSDAMRRAIAARPDIASRTSEELEAIQTERLFATLEQMRAPFKKTVGELTAAISDMPTEVLDGWLGQVCRERMAGFPVAYSWPAILVAASVLVPKSKTRTNLYVAMVGPPGTGKSSAFEFAFYLFGLEKPTLQRIKSGSAEGLASFIGDADGAARLFFPDELAHLLTKAAIEGSSFATLLSTMYYENHQESTIAHQKLLRMNCRLSIAGGIPEEQFGELFGAATQQGFYQRFLLSQCPTGFGYLYRPPDGGPVITPPDFSEGESETAMTTSPGKPIAVDVDASVWEERNSWVKNHGIDARVAEHAIRVAVICASFDGRATIYGKDLGPAFALAKYENRMRQALAPNPGKNTDGILTFKVSSYLKTHAALGEWVNQRSMLQSIRAYDYGAPTIERVIHGMTAAGLIDTSRNGRQKVIRLNLDR
jgi:hypothetical protein